jgi:hypothetical protein
MRPRPFSAPIRRASRFVLGTALAAALGACATTLALRGAHEGKRLISRVEGTVAGGIGKLTLDMENRGDQVIGLDLDGAILDDGKAGKHHPLGKLQRYQHEGQSVSERVPHGVVSVEPGAKERVPLDFDGLPADGTFTLEVPAVYRMDIEGQVPMKPLSLPLAADKGEATASAATPDGGFFDPFVE